MASKITALFDNNHIVASSTKGKLASNNHSNYNQFVFLFLMDIQNIVFRHLVEQRELLVVVEGYLYLKPQRQSCAAPLAFFHCRLWFSYDSALNLQPYSIKKLLSLFYLLCHYNFDTIQSYLCLPYRTSFEKSPLASDEFCGCYSKWSISYPPRVVT